MGYQRCTPSIRKFGYYQIPDQKFTNPLCFRIESENDLHKKVISFLRTRYPQSLLTIGSGELQDSSDKRLESYAKGYLKGTPYIIIQNPSKWHNGFCIELKTPIEKVRELSMRLNLTF